jgi:hypothetical protein
MVERLNKTAAVRIARRNEAGVTNLRREIKKRQIQQNLASVSSNLKKLKQIPGSPHRRRGNRLPCT